MQVRILDDEGLEILWVKTETGGLTSSSFRRDGTIERIITALERALEQARAESTELDSEVCPVVANSEALEEQLTRSRIVGKRIVSDWQVVVYDDCVSFKRVDNGRMQESYPPVPISKAAVYAAAIVQGLQPPRDLRVCDKPVD